MGMLGSLQELMQFGRDSISPGTRGPNLSFPLALPIGLLALVWLEGQEAA
jgi:hypothetical protein